MHELRRISINNWYLIDDARDIDLRGITALIGPTGAGKSSLLDAVQTVMTGNNQNNLRLNASASTLNERSVIQYCLGYVDPEESSEPARPDGCETILALTFVNPDLFGGTEQVTAGVVMTARPGDRNAHTVCQFLIKGFDFRLRDFVTRAQDGTLELPMWETIARQVRAKLADPRDLREYKTARTYVTDLLAIMRLRSNPPDPRQFLNAFANAVAFKPIQDTTQFVRRHLLRADPLDISGVRASIKRYRDNAEEAARIEEKLKAVYEVGKRFDEWARLVLRHVELQWRLASLRTEETRAVLAKSTQEYQAASIQLDNLEKTKRRQESEIQTLIDELGAKTSLRDDSGQTSRRQQIKLRSEKLKGDLRELNQMAETIRSPLNAVANIASVKDYVSHRIMAVIAEARKVVDLIDGTAGLDWLRHYEREVTAALASLPQVGALAETLTAVIEPLRLENAQLEQDKKDIAAQLAEIRDGGVGLSNHTRELIDELKLSGIEAVPLCNVVEVADTGWQYALEVLLGNSREALIVEPAKVRRAFDILYRNRNKRGWKNCRLVKTDRTDRSRWERLSERSIARAISSENDHVLCYLAVNVGSYLKVDSEDELANADRAIMRNGKMTANHAYSVNEDNIALLFGAAAREANRARLLERQQQIANELPEKKRLETRLQQAISMAERFKNMQVPDVAAAAYKHDAIRREHEGIERDRIAIEAEGDPQLMQVIRELEKELEDRRAEIRNETEPEHKAAIQRQAKAEQTYQGARAGMREAISELRVARREVRTPDVALAIEMLPGTHPISLRPYIGQRLKFAQDADAALAFYAAERKARLGDATADKQLKDLTQRVATVRATAFSELDECVRSWGYEHPAPTRSNPEPAYRWLRITERRLREHELRNWLNETQTALLEMHRMLKEHVLTQLSDKFNHMRRQMDALNRRLVSRAFAKKYYKFKAEPDPTMSPIRRLADEVAKNPDIGQQIVEGRVEDETLRQALADLEQHLEEGGDERIDDYRQYYTYEFLLSDHPENGPWLPIGAKVRVASGGETQLPFYVAMASSLAMAYFPGDAGSLALPEGIGLAMFDEAFNKLDIINTQALFDFYRSLGLQLFVAAPEAQRPVFTEVVDCIITINKDVAQSTVYIDTEYPKELAKEALRAINPDHKGLDGFRAEMAAETAAAPS